MWKCGKCGNVKMRARPNERVASVAIVMNGRRGIIFN
jgi:hypothetical protein